MLTLFDGRPVILSVWPAIYILAFVPKALERLELLMTAAHHAIHKVAAQLYQRRAPTRSMRWNLDHET